MSTKLESAIIHIANTAEEYPILSNLPLRFDSEVADYLSKAIEKTFLSDDIKSCFFKSEINLWQQCKDVSWNLVAVSQSIAKEMFTIMHRNKEIPMADLLFGIANINNCRYFFMLKFDYRSAFTHFVKTVDGQVSIEIIQHHALFPVQAPKIAEGFFVDMDAPSVKVIERKYTVDGIKDFYISSQILACTESKSPRQKTTKLLQVAEKVANLYYPDEDEMDVHISATMHEELQKEDVLLIENLGQKFFPKNPAAQEEFFERLSAADISKDEELSLSEQFRRKFQKQAIRTASGVEIKIPTQIYTNADEIEFINNPDGTVSLLIKNIEL